VFTETHSKEYRFGLPIFPALTHPQSPLRCTAVYFFVSLRSASPAQPASSRSSAAAPLVLKCSCIPPGSARFRSAGSTVPHEPPVQVLSAAGIPSPHGVGAAGGSSVVASSASAGVITSAPANLQVRPIRQCCLKMRSADGDMHICAALWPVCRDLDSSLALWVM